MTEIFNQKVDFFQENLSLHAKIGISQTFYSYNHIPKSGTFVILLLDLNLLGAYFCEEVNLFVNFVNLG